MPRDRPLPLRCRSGEQCCVSDLGMQLLRLLVQMAAYALLHTVTQSMCHAPSSSCTLSSLKCLALRAQNLKPVFKLCVGFLAAGILHPAVGSCSKGLTLNGQQQRRTGGHLAGVTDATLCMGGGVCVMCVGRGNNPFLLCLKCCGPAWFRDTEPVSSHSLAL